MNLVIKKLSPELINDYIDYFDNIAFADNDEWAGCYCVWYHWNDKFEEERKEYMASGGKCFKRELAVRLIEEGILQGYLAYADGSVVGWVNANDKENYDALSRDRCQQVWVSTGVAEKVKSIVCFTISPAMRHRGIATQLLDRVCEEARVDGYACVEAYPGQDAENIQRNYHGPFALYEKKGFSKYRNLEGQWVVRKYL